MRVLVAVDHEHRAVAPVRTRRGTLGSPQASRPTVGVGQRGRVDLEPPADAVLDLLGRVRLGEHPPRRRTRGSPRSRAASSGGCTSPSPRLRVERLVERSAPAARAVARRQRHRRADGDEAEHPLGMVGRELDRPQRRRTRARRARPARCRWRRARPACRRRTRGGCTPRRPTGRPDAPGAAAVEVTTRWWRARCGTCSFQKPGRDDRPRRQQHDRGRSPSPKASQCSVDAVALDVPVGVGLDALSSRLLGRVVAALLGWRISLADAAQAGPDRQLVAVEAEQQQRLGADERVADQRRRPRPA